MARSMWFTRPPYAGQWISMTDADASIARENFWAFNTLPGANIDPALVDTAYSSFVPATHQASLDTWLAKVNAGTYDPFADAAPPANPQPPTAVALTPSSIARNQAVGTTVGLLSATDADQPDGGHEFSTTDQNFRISGLNQRTVQVAKKPGPGLGAYAMAIRVKDETGLTYDGTVTITITS